MSSCFLIDQVGREIDFLYYTNYPYQLTAITAPGADGQAQVLARITYQDRPFYVGIDATDPTKDYMDTIPAMQAIYFPATHSGYWFGELDSYNSYGMIVNVREQVQMSFTGSSLTDPGTVTPGQTVRQRIYDYPSSAPASGDRLAPPRYQNVTEIVRDAPGPFLTHYDFIEQAAATTIAVRLPDQSRRLTVIDPTSGLLQAREVYAQDDVRLSREDDSWILGPDNVQRLSQLTETNVSNRQRRITYGYTAQGYQQDMRTFDWADAATPDTAPLLRLEHFTYVDDPSYVQRGISGLISREEIYDSASLLPEERTDFEYDVLTPVPVTGQIPRNIYVTPGFRPDLRAALPANADTKKGTLQRIKRWQDPQNPANTTVIVSESGYTDAGVLGSVKTAGLIDRVLMYSPAGGYALPDSMIIGSGSAQVATDFSWNLSTGKLASSVRLGQLSQYGYDNARRLTSVQDGDTAISSAPSLPTRCLIRTRSVIPPACLRLSRRRI